MSTSLNAPRSGYLYQDLISAMILARAVIAPRGVEIALDRPLRAGDRFDDIDAIGPTFRLRRQVKFSLSEEATLALTDFTTTKRQLRIDDLITSAKADYCFSAAQYSVTTPFVIDETLAPFLVREMHADAIEGAVWRLNADEIWPSQSTPRWKPLQGMDRPEFLAFAERFTIEPAPRASLDLDAPGALERTLFAILADDIGVGIYPNAQRQVTDVAAVLIHIATTVRVRGGMTSADDVVRRLGLRTDYGRIAQQFPIVRDALVERTVLVDTLATRVVGTNALRLVGPPGAGKSWLLSATADVLRERHVIVARHYCYLEPGDEHVQRRVMTQTLFANLTAEILDQLPALAHSMKPLYGSGPRELERLLRAAAEDDPDRQIVLLVDGLDHIGRVVETSTSVVREDATIIDDLATLEAPSNVHLVIASQPGIHLKPLEDVTDLLAMPPWTAGEIGLLAANLRLTDILADDAGLQPDAIAETLKVLTERAEGNPLYATFLCRTVEQEFREQGALPLEVLRGTPPIRGDITTYYASLLPPEADVARVVAEVLAFVEFGVTADELRTILPLAPASIDLALRRLRPVLRRVSAQGGIRLYHESFRRYVVETASDGVAAAARVLSPVIAWLENEGFFADSRAYRFLLPLQARVGDTKSVLSRVTPNFVEQSAGHAHAPAAIAANLQLAANLALEADDWPAFVRIIELDRARMTYESRITSPTLLTAYARTFMVMHGAMRLSERLLFDGKPTMDREAGLLLCSRVDDAGATPPWQEYTAIPEPDEDQRRDDTSVEEASFHAFVRRNPAEAPRALVAWLNEHGASASPSFVLALVRRVLTVEGLVAFGDLPEMAGRAAALLRLGIATYVHASGNPVESRGWLDNVSAADVPLPLLHTFGSISGRIADAFGQAADVADTKSVLPDDDRFQTEETAAWIAATRLAARVAPDRLDAARASITGSRWQHAWLRFAVDLARGEALDIVADRDAAVLRALQDLIAATEHPNPFSIYGGESSIHESFQRALEAVSPAAFPQTVTLLRELSQSTHSHFQGSSMGPLVTEAFLSIVAPFVSTHSEIALAAMTARVAAAEAYGEFYETHAEHDLQLAQAFTTAGRHIEADDRWSRAVKNLTAYGQRRDTTAFEPMESLEVLATIDVSAARDCVRRTQRFADNVDDHTDGKETKWVYHRWFDALRAADPEMALTLLAEATGENGGHTSWRLEHLFEAIADQLPDVGVSPVLAAYIQASARGKGSLAAVAPRARALRALLASHPAERHLVTVLAASIQGDAGTIEHDAERVLASLAGDHGVTFQRLPLRASERSAGPAVAASDFARLIEPNAPLPHTARDLVVLFNRAGFAFRDDPKAAERYAEQLGYRLLAFDDELACIRLLRTFARAAHYSGGDAVLMHLAEGFSWRGMHVLAATAYALAFAYVRPEWSVFGSREANPRFAAALQEDEEVARGVLRSEAKHIFAAYGGSHGLTQHLIELFGSLGERDRAFAIWNASVEVIERRLPLTSEASPLLPAYDPEGLRPASIDEAAATLLIARVQHPEIHRKRAALAGIAAAVRYQERSFLVPFARMLRPEMAITTRLALLDILYMLGPEASWCLGPLQPALQAAASDVYFGIRWLARALLAQAGHENFAPPAEVHIPDTELSVDARRMLVAVDDRVQLLDRVVPGFESAFARALNELSKDEERKAAIRARSKNLYDRVNERFPKHVLYGSDELIEETLHRVATALVPDTEDHADTVGEILRPSIEQYIAHWHSRTARPAGLLRPNGRVEGRSAPEAITDATFDGWYRIGYYEYELVRDAARWKIGGDALAMTGVQLHPGGPPALTRLFVRGARRQTGTTLCLCIMQDTERPLGRVHVLLPAVELGQVLQLSGDSWNEPIMASRKDGVGIVFRQWREEPLGEELEREEAAISGCELLLRPDLFRDLYSMAAGWVSDVAFVDHAVRSKDSASEDAG